MNSKRENLIKDPVTPGELLKDEFLLPLGITKYRLAKEIGVPAQRISEIAGQLDNITPFNRAI